jgi:uncharacterized RDD family membrane protein YckC
VRCGRRLHSSSTRPAPQGYSPNLNAPIQTATAPALDRLSIVPNPLPQKAEPVKKEAPAVPAGREYQPFLFQEGLNGPKVVPIPTLPGSQKSRSQKAAPHRGATRARRGSPGERPPQQDFDFPETSRASLDMQVEVICCDAPVALPAHRIIAGAADLSMILIGVGLFLGVFWVAGGDIVLNRQTGPALAGVVFGIALFYRLLWCIANVDTPGMRFAGLRLVDFDGRTPGREQRGKRQLAGLLSVLSAGLGLIWAMVDEENLTWHDQISKTFPTPG